MTKEISKSKISVVNSGGFKYMPHRYNAEVFERLCNWTHSALIVRKTADRGLGVFSTADISKGELVIMYGGRVLTGAQLQLLPTSEDMVVQVEEDLFFVAIDWNELGIGERINHSCDPNVGFSGQMSVVAMRDISAGEEITMDYALCDGRESFYLRCACGEALCRKTIRGSDWQRGDLQAKYYEYFQPFLQRRISRNFSRRVGNG